MHSYAYISQSTAPPVAPVQDADNENVAAYHHDSSIPCFPGGYCGMNTACRPAILYTLCVVLNTIAMVYKQVLLYWFGLCICTLLCVTCHRCSTLALVLQMALGVFMYIYWFNFFNLWHRPRYHHSTSWPWTPSP